MRLTFRPILSFVLVLTCFQLTYQVPINEEDNEIRNGRIVNGSPAKFGEFPYQASVLLGNYPYCGGALVAKQWVATAAHCVMHKSAEQLRVILGALDIKDPQNPTYYVKRILHHDYDDHTKIGDVSLLQLDLESASPDIDSRLESHPVKPVELPPLDFDPTGLNCIVSGWGHKKSHSSSAPKDLQEVGVEVVSADGCWKMLGPNYPWDRFSDSMICAGGKDKDACQGDSGGPLVCTDDKNPNKRYLTGIVSWGVGCATEGIPGVYTNVRHYEDWINEQIKKYQDS